MVNSTADLSNALSQLRREAGYIGLLVEDIGVEYFDGFVGELEHSEGFKNKADVHALMELGLTRYGKMADIALHFIASLCAGLEQAETFTESLLNGGK
jgi:hypothetical protein